MKKIVFVLVFSLFCMGQVFGFSHKALSEKERHQCCGVQLKEPDQPPFMNLSVVGHEWKSYSGYNVGDAAFYYVAANHPSAWPDPLDFEGGGVPVGTLVFDAASVNAYRYWDGLHWHFGVDLTSLMSQIPMSVVGYRDGFPFDTVQMGGADSGDSFDVPICDSVVFVFPYESNQAYGNYALNGYSSYYVPYILVSCRDSLENVVSTESQIENFLQLSAIHALSEKSHFWVNATDFTGTLYSHWATSDICPTFPVEGMIWRSVYWGRWGYPSYLLSYYYSFDGYGSSDICSESPFMETDNVMIDTTEAHIEYVHSVLALGLGRVKAIEVGKVTSDGKIIFASPHYLVGDSVTNRIYAVDSTACTFNPVDYAPSFDYRWVGLDEGAGGDKLEPSNNLNKCYDCWAGELEEEPFHLVCKNLKYSNGSCFRFPLYNVSLFPSYNANPLYHR